MSHRGPSIEQVRSGLRATLESYKASGLVDHVRILAGCCSACDVDEGVVPLDLEMTHQRLPHGLCERADGGACPCAYSPVVASG